MNKILLFIFSGTGNTLIISNLIKEEFTKYNYHTDIYNISLPFKDIPNIDNYDYIGFGYPIHAFNTPKFFLDFIKKLPNTSKPTFIFKTSGEPFIFNNSSSYSLSKILTKKGYNILFEEHYLMPYYIMFSYPLDIAKHMYLVNKDLVKIMVSNILKNTKIKTKYNPFNILFMYISRFQWFGAFINSPFIKVDKKLCNNCGLCIDRCPTLNITSNKDYPKFNYKCTMCMKCVTICPKDAIKFGIINIFKVRANYQFESLINDENIPNIRIDKSTKGYFKSFRKYYKKVYQKLDK